MNTVNLTAREREQAREKAVKAIRTRLQERKPHRAQYDTETGRAARIIAATLLWSRAAVPVVALLAALASSVRTVQVVSTIYSDAGSHPVGVLLAALAFTLAAEGALFVLALARAGEDLKRRAEGRERHVSSLAGLWRGVKVRIGIEQPLRHDQMPESSGRIGTVLMLALLFTLSTNLYLGMKPLIDEIGATSLQDFAGSLVNAPARLQMVAVVDFSAALFAPLVAFAAGHLTAHFAAEVAQHTQAGQRAYDSDLQTWRDAYATPMDTEEGRELLAEYIEDAQKTKINRQQRRKARQAAETAETPALEYIEGDESEETAESRPFTGEPAMNGH